MSPRAPRMHGDPPRFVTSRLLEDHGLPHLFTTRHFPGVGKPTEPRPPFGPEAAPLLAARGLAPGAAFARQVHGAAVLRVERGGLAGPADALATGRPGLPLAISTADCLPIVLYDARAGRLAAVHAGWRGTVQAVARAAVAELVAAGSAATELVVAIGPSIGPCCYEVDAPVIDRFEAAFPGAREAWFLPKGPGKWMLDLWRANVDQLIGAGVPPERVDLLRLCTGCRPDLLFSYRREKGAGRLVAVAALPERAC
ncbi:MAG TPA: peptidoglycan editing factor PgeF [Candidatus Deferrimicrobiaceae bacterium]|nr:peptidoglycan editing factor PgeF [Candidatus Deferrimicrobiaceae bacterium]